jgi:GNAT superfamily N-acetyltransferase
MRREARADDDEAIVRMCGALNAEDPGPHPVPPDHMRRTVAALREAPPRGRVLVLELGDRVCGYALLVSFWSNEAGGEACLVDEVYVEAPHRGQGHTTRLLSDLAAKADKSLPDFVALLLEVTPANDRARRLYERLGFVPGNRLMRQRLKR